MNSKKEAVMVQGANTERRESLFSKHTQEQLRNLTLFPHRNPKLMFFKVQKKIEKQRPELTIYFDEKRMTMLTNKNTKQSYKPYLCKGRIVFIHILNGNVYQLNEI